MSRRTQRDRSTGDRSRRHRSRKARRLRSLNLERLEERRLLAVNLWGVPQWEEVGPAQIHGGSTAGIRDEAVSGAIQAVAPHPGNSEVLFVGSVSGGLWRTTNATDAEPNWTPLIEEYPALSIGALAVSPLDAIGNPVTDATPWDELVVYAGTGSFSNSAIRANTIGFLRSENGGQTWRLLDREVSGEAIGNFFLGLAQINSIAATGNDLGSGEVVLVGASDGLYRSLDGGHNFEQLLDEPLPLGDISDVLVDPLDHATLFAASPGAGIFRSNDSGETWELVNSGMTDVSATTNIQLSAQVVPGLTPHSVIYAGLVHREGPASDPAFRLAGVYRTDNGGDEWDPLGSVPEIHPGGQGNRNFSILADQHLAGAVVVGGDTQPRASGDPPVANLQRWNPDGGPVDDDPTTGVWESIVLGGANDTAPHADSRDLAFDARGTLIEVDDGGIYRLNPPDDFDVGFGTWTSLNGDLAINEQHSVAFDETHGVYLAGTQDNGSAQQRNYGDLNWESIFLGTLRGEPETLGGDGNTQQIDNSNPLLSIRYSLANNFQFFFRHGYDADNRQVDLVTPELHPFQTALEHPSAATNNWVAAPVLLARPGQQSRTTRFGEPLLSGLLPADQSFNRFDTIPYVINQIDPSRLLIGYRGLYESFDRGDTIEAIQAADTAAGRQVTALVYGGRETILDPDTGATSVVDRPDVVYASRGNDLYVRRAGSSPREFESIQLSGPIQDIALDPLNWRIAYVATDTGLIRVEVGAELSAETIPFTGLAGRPTQRLHSIEVLRQDEDLVVLLGGQDGIYRSINPSAESSVWARFGQGLPAVAVTDIDYHDIDLPDGGRGLLVAATLGRGTWAVPNAGLDIATPAVLEVAGDNPFEANSFELRRNEFVPTLLDVTVNDVLRTTIPAASLEQIMVTGGVGPDSLQVDSTVFGPISVPVHFDGGDAMDTLQITTRPEDSTVDKIEPTDADHSGFHIISGTVYGAPDRDAQQVVLFENVETLDEATAGGEEEPTVEQHQVSSLVQGLQQLIEWSSAANSPELFPVDLPMIGSQLHRALDGATATAATSVGDPLFFTQPAGNTDSPGTSFLAQIFQTASGSPGGGGLETLDSLDDFRDWLDSLDAVVGNIPDPVIDGDTVTFDVTVVDRTITGTVAVDNDLISADGEIELAGLIDVSATADVHLKLGVDSEGFFINPEDNPNPEFEVGNLSMTGDLLGRLGVMGVRVPDAEVVFADGLSISVDVHDPGTLNPETGSVEVDGLIRLQPSIDRAESRPFGELSAAEANRVATVTVVGTGTESDAQLHGEVTALPVVPDSEGSSTGLADLVDAELTLVWPDADTPDIVQIDQDHTDPGLASLLNVSVDQVAAGLTSFAASLELLSVAGSLNVDLPILSVSIDGLLDLREPVILDSSAELQTRVSEVFEEDGLQKFSVTVQEFNLPAHGVAVGDTVEFRAAGDADSLISGTIEHVDFGRITVSFRGDASDEPDRDDPLIRILTSNSLTRRLRAAFGELTDFETLNFQAPTVQDLVQQIAVLLDVDPGSVPLRFFGGSEPALEFTVDVALESIVLDKAVDLGRLIPGLSGLDEEMFHVELDPGFLLTIGIELAPPSPDVALSDRVYLAPSSEVSMGFDVRWDGAHADTSVGFLDVLVDSSGIELHGVAGFGLQDFDGDGRVHLRELEAVVVDGSHTLPPVFEPTVYAQVSGNLQLTPHLDAESTLPPASILIDRLVEYPEDFADLADDVATQIAIQAADYIRYDNVSPEMILEMLPTLAARLEDLVGGRLLDTRLPLVNKSLAELVDLERAFNEAYASPEEAAVQTVAALGEFLGAEATFVNSEEVTFVFQFGGSESEARPFSFGVGREFSLTGEGTVEVSASLQGRVVLGISTADDVSPPERFFLDAGGTVFGLSARADLGGYDLDGDGSPDSDPLSLEGRALSKDVGIERARGLIELSAAASAIDNRVDDVEDDVNRLTLLEISEGGFDVGVELGASPFAEIAPADRIQMVIPLNGDGDDRMTGFRDDNLRLFDPSELMGGDAVVEVFGRLSHLAAGFAFDATPPADPHDVSRLRSPGELDAEENIVVQAHNLDGFITEGLLSFDGLLDGLEEFVAFADRILGSDVLDFKLPLIGKSIGEGLDFVGDLACSDPDNPSTLGELVACISSLVGSDEGVSTAAGILEAYLTDEDLPFEPIDDLPVLTTTGDDANPDSVLFQFAYAPTFNFDLLSPDPDDPENPNRGTLIDGFDLGLDFLRLAGEDVRATFTGGLTMLLGFGIDREEGFFIKTFSERPEISVSATLTMTGTPALELGPIEVGATFDANDFVTVNFGIDLGEEDRISLGELLTGEALSSVLDTDAISLTVDSHLDVPLTLNVDVGATTLPLVTTDFLFDWGFSDVNSIPAPTVVLDQIMIPVGDIIDRVGGQVLDTVRENNPLSPILEEIDKPLPILGDSLLDLFLEKNEGMRDNPIFKLLLTASTIGDIGEHTISFGSLEVVRGRDGQPQMAGVDPDEPEPLLPGDWIPIPEIRDALAEWNSEFGITFPVLELRSIFDFLVAEKDVDLIRFVPTVPLQLGLFYGSELPFVSYGFKDIASVDAKASFSAGIGLDADLSFGLDTRGLRDDEESDLSFLDGIWIGDFAPGLDGRIGPGDPDIAEVALGGSIEASIAGSAQVGGFEFARLSGTGSIIADVGINLNDDNPDTRSEDDRFDGKFHLDEIATVLADHHNNPICLFDLTGGLSANVGLNFKIDLGIFPDIKFGADKDFSLIDFELACPPEPPPDLLASLDGTTLTLTATDSAADDDYAQTAATNHPDGDRIDFLLVDKDGDNDDDDIPGPETLRVKKGTVIEDFGPHEESPNWIASINDIELIQGSDSGLLGAVGSLGAGPDEIYFDPGIRAKVLFFGGDGDDVLVTAGGGGALFGGEGADTLQVADDSIGNPIFGGQYNSLLVGGGGDDHIYGGLGRDLIVGDYSLQVGSLPSEFNEGSDFIDSGGNRSSESEMIWGDNQPAMGDVDGPLPDSNLRTSDEIFTGSGKATVFAGAGDDVVVIDPLRSTPPGSGIVYGGPGNDSLRGGEGDDVLIGDFDPNVEGDEARLGEPGDDTLEGGGGNDELYGGWTHFATNRIPTDIRMGEDVLLGNSGNDLLDGIDSAFVRAVGGEGNDTVLGSVGNDLLYGDEGDDLLAGGPGSDLIRGGIGNDGILGGVGSIDNELLFLTQTSGNVDRTDRLFGDDGDDVILGDNGSIREETFTGYKGFLEWDYRIVTRTYTNPFQGGGDDLIVGGKGDDQLFGGAGGDFIFGDSDFAFFQGGVPSVDITPDPGDDTIIGDQGTIELNQYRFHDFSFTTTYSIDIVEDTSIIRSDVSSVFADPGSDSISADELYVDAPGGNDLVFGGEDGDAIRTSAGEDTVFGDLAEAYLYDYRRTGSGPQGDISDIEHEHYIASIEQDLGGPDVIQGGPDADILVGGTGGDEVFGNDGRDILFGDHAAIHFGVDENVETIQSNHTLIGGEDLVDGGLGQDIVFGGIGHDQVFAGPGADRNVLFGDVGMVEFEDGEWANIVPDLEGLDWTVSGNDELYGSDGDDLIVGGLGSDTAYGADGDDTIYGDLAEIHDFNLEPDEVTISSVLPEQGSGDNLYGEGGNDYLDAGAGHDGLSGGLGDNILLGMSGSDAVVEQGDVDFDLYDTELFFGDAYDVLDSIERAHLTGGESANLINASGFTGTTRLFGRDGNDELVGGVNSDFLVGGNGADRLYGLPGGDVLIGGEIVAELAPEDEGDELHGMSGDDVLLGQLGRDLLDGGPGHDRIDGGEGDDIHWALMGTDIIPDGLYHTCTVDNTGDDGEGTLRWAIDCAESVEDGVLAVVDFQILPSDPQFQDVDSIAGGDAEPDVFRIAPLANTPQLSRGSVVVNGFSQDAFLSWFYPAYADANPTGPEIVLDGRGLLGRGLLLTSDENGVYGLSIQRFLGSGVHVLGDRNKVVGNYVGTDARGTLDRGNGGIGVFVIDASFNVIENNLVSGNDVNGVVLAGPMATNNTVRLNRIGTDRSESFAIGNTLGVHIGNAPDNIVESNVISGNLVGIDVSGVNATGNIVRGNRIGATSHATATVGNAADGIFIDGAPGNTVTDNTVAGNGANGIKVWGDDATGNRIRFNSIHSNAGLGIDLGTEGVTANDPLDVDEGPNSYQNYPVIFSVSAGEHTIISGTLDGTPNTSFDLDFFASTEVDASGYGEGERYLGSVTASTDESGYATFNAVVNASLPTEWITATATASVSGDTSEFSAAHATSSYIVTNTNDSGPGSLRAAIEFVNNLVVEHLPPGERPRIEFQIPLTDTNYVDVDSSLPDGDADPDVFVISPLSPLPAITVGRVVVNGQTQLEFTGDTNPFGPEIVLNGSAVTPTANGLHLNSAGNRVHGLNIQQFTGHGILVTGDGNELTGNYLGTDATGREARSNGGDGVRIVASNGNVIGGQLPTFGAHEDSAVPEGDHVLQIGEERLTVDSYSWSAVTPFDFDTRIRGVAQPALFHVQTDVLAGGDLYEDLISGQVLGDIVLESYASGGVYQTWTLENARVVSYEVKDDADSIIPTVQLDFGFRAIETKFYDDGVEIVGATSRLDLSGETPVASGGGAGPESATSGEHLLQIEDATLAVENYSWGVTKPFDFGDRRRGEAQPQTFYVQTDATSAGGLFADLAAGHVLDDVQLQSYDSTGNVYQSWTLENVRVVSYSVTDDADSIIPAVQLAFGFEAIETTFYEDGVEIAGTTSRLDLAGETPVTSGGGAGPDSAASGEHLLHIDDTLLEVGSYSWDVSAPFQFSPRMRGTAQPQLFYAQTEVTGAGGLFADLAAGRLLGDIQLQSFAPVGSLYQSWSLENARVVSYAVRDDAETLLPTVQLAFGFDAIETTFFEDGVEIVGSTSRLEVSGETPVASGGGAGPEIATSGEHLLQIDDATLAVESYSWGVTTPFDFIPDVRHRAAAESQLFYVQTDVTSGGGLFADLAAGQLLGDIRLRSYSSAGGLYQSWTLENARVVSYGVMDDADSVIPTVQLAFSFSAIETTFFEDGVEIVGTTSRLDISGETPESSGGGAGPESATSGEHLLRIDDTMLVVGSYSWDIFAPFQFRPRARGTAQPQRFNVQTEVTSAGELFADLAAGRVLDEVELRSYSSAGSVYQSWTLENARVVSYRVMDDAETPIPTVQLAFGFEAIETTRYEDGVEIAGSTSRLDLSDEIPTASGGGVGPDSAISGEHLLQIDGAALAVDSYSWGVTTPFDFDSAVRSRADAHPQLFSVQTDATGAGGLFADLAAGRLLDEIELRSYTSTGNLYQTWTLENASVASYRILDDAASSTPKVELAFGFESIGATFPFDDASPDGNVIAGDGGNGITIEGGEGNIVKGNYIGVGAEGAAELGNSDGILLHDTGNNVVGGVSPREGNIIAANQRGVVVDGFDAIGNTIRGNSIYSNVGLGIDLSGDGVTPNDIRDLDAGPNDLQNIPVIGLAQNGDTTRVAGVLHSSPFSSFTLDFYAVIEPDPTYHGEGRRWLGSGMVTTDANGNGSYEVVLDAATESGERITATATNAGGSTSEFSQSISDDVPANTLVVTNTNDNGLGSLREAIVAANQITGEEPVHIWFRLPTTDPNFVDIDSHLPDGDALPDVYVFSPQIAFPALTRGDIIIDGQSQFKLSGGGKNPFGPMIVLNGGAISETADGLHLSSSGNRVHGITIQQFTGDGILVTAAGNELTGNYIGTSADGFETRSNGGDGVRLVDASGNVIGGAGGAARNVISGNSGNGIGISGGVGNIVQGNYIGTTADGLSRLGNAGSGIRLQGSSDNQIGGNTPEARNVISANSEGVLFYEASTNNVVLGNYVGVGADGRTELGNNDGVYFRLSSDNQLGGTTADVRNVVAGNRRFNVVATGTSGNKIQGNYIGVDYTGDDRVYFSSAGIGVLNNTDILIGGVEPGAGNVISGTGRGIWLYGGNAARDTVIQRNLIGTSADGKHAVGNAFGISIIAAGDGTGSTGNKVFDTTIGGLDPAARNVISGNTEGISIIGENALGTKILGNYIGTDIDGEYAIPNTEQGIRVQAASGVVIGGTEAGAGNVISGNGGSGISIEGSAPDTKFQTFYSSLAWQSGWQGFGNTSNRNHFTSNLYVPGLTDDSFVAGGTFARHSTEQGETGLTPIAYYADPRIGGTLTLDDPIHGDGQLVITATDDFDGGVLVSHFDRTSADANRGGMVLGLAVLEPNPREPVPVSGLRIKAVLALSNGQLLYGISETGISINAPAGLAEDTLYNWSYNYDPQGGNQGYGRLTVEVFADGTSLGTNWIDLTAQHRAVGASFDAFGLYTGGAPARSNNPNTVTLYIDNVTYTRAMGNTIQGNYIGTNANGTADLGNATGVVITDSTGNLVGGSTEAARNVVSASSSGYGVVVQGVTSTENTLEGNYIGTDVSGSLDLGNHLSGVLLSDATDNLLRRNVISGNDDNGVLIVGSTPTTDVTNLIEANYIGTDAMGTRDLGNALMGVRVQRGIGPVIRGNVVSGNDNSNILVDSLGSQVLVEQNFIGTDASGNAALLDPNGLPGGGVTLVGRDNVVRGNVISANPVDGVNLDGQGVADGRGSGNILQANLIGVGFDSVTPLGNGRDGVRIWRGARDNKIGTDGDGLLDESEGNIIAFNVGDGVRVTGAETSGNSIRRNSIGSNGGLGIDLGGDGVTSNDHQDGDAGPNGWQNFAGIGSAVYNIGLDITRVVVNLDSTPDSNYTIDLYAVAGPDAPTGHGEGRRWLGALAASTNRNGGFSRSIGIASVAVGEFITATATDAFGNTSEFSYAVQVNTRGGGPTRGGPGNGRPGNGGGNPNALLSAALYDLSAGSSNVQTIAADEIDQPATKAADSELLVAAIDQVFATLEDDRNARDFELNYLPDDDALVEGVVAAGSTIEPELDFTFADLGSR